MRKIQIALLAMVVILSACSEEQSASNYQEISVSELSTNITSFIDENYPDATIVSALQAEKATEASFIVALNTSEEIAFDASGTCLGNAEDLSVARHQRKGGPKHGGGHGGHHGQIPGGIPVDSLPSNISTFVSTNYANSKIIGARLDSTCQFGSVINVMVRELRTAPTRLTFDLSGNYLFKAERALYASLPQAVIDTISANYTVNANVKNKAEKLTLASNSTIEYTVYLRNNNVRTAVTLLENGTIVCTK
jgi:Putative beta-lactamase-inhibitor-like, PepSY-like